MARNKSRIAHVDSWHEQPSRKPCASSAIRHQDMMFYLVEACPSFRRPMERIKRRTHTKLVYILLGYFAGHLLKLCQNGNYTEFPATAGAIEHLYIHGTDYVKNALTGGLLEIFNIHACMNNIDPEQFTKHLKPVSRRYWLNLNQYHDE